MEAETSFLYLFKDESLSNTAWTLYFKPSFSPTLALHKFTRSCSYIWLCCRNVYLRIIKYHAGMPASSCIHLKQHYYDASVGIRRLLADFPTLVLHKAYNFDAVTLPPLKSSRWSRQLGFLSPFEHNRFKFYKSLASWSFVKIDFFRCPPLGPLCPGQEKASGISMEISLACS